MALRSEPPREKDTGNNKEINTDSTKPFPKPLPPAQAGPQRALRDKYTRAGMCSVFVGSKPYLAWLAFRGADGIPGFVDDAFINGKSRKIVWMPSVYPRKDEGEGGGRISSMLGGRTGGPASYAKSWN